MVSIDARREDRDDDGAAAPCDFPRAPGEPDAAPEELDRHAGALDVAVAHHREQLTPPEGFEACAYASEGRFVESCASPGAEPQEGLGEFRRIERLHERNERAPSEGECAANELGVPRVG